MNILHLHFPFFKALPAKSFDTEVIIKILLLNVCNAMKNLHFSRTFTQKEDLPIFLQNTQPAITCSKLTIERLEQGVKYVQS